jgi:DNA-binding NtrC family response regulator
VEQKSIARLGDPQRVSVDVRVITATNRRLEEEVTAGRFREDLFHRLNEVRIHIPPLTSRREDIIVLLQHFIGELAGVSQVPVDAEATRLLLSYDWPGNVRELRNVARRIVDKGVPASISAATLTLVFPQRIDRGTESDGGVEQRVEAFARRAYLEEVARHEYNIRKTARSLEMPYGTLRSRLKSLGILDIIKEKTR